MMSSAKEWAASGTREINELLSSCTTQSITYKGVKGFKVTGPNGNSIFFPAAGYSKGTSVYGRGLYGYYWSGTSDGRGNATYQSLYQQGNTPHNIYSYCGLPIRPVKGVLPPELTQDDTNRFSTLKYTDMVLVSGGTFWMGAQSSSSSGRNYDSEAYSDESPVHQVTLGSYYIGKYEVTQQLWEFVMGYSGVCADGSTMSAYSSDPWLGSNPSSSYGKGDYYPAYYVSHDDIVNVFLPRLNRITGREYSLPTEAEWEYAARGSNKSKGYKYSGSNNLGDVAWYYSNSNSSTYVVGTKQPNELGIYDMSGNVHEWCSDWYGSYSSSSQTDPTGPFTGSGRVYRGGDWYYSAQSCRVSYRDYHDPDFRSGIMGFRLVLRRL